MILLALFLLGLNIGVVLITRRMRRSGIPLTALVLRSHSKHYLVYLYYRIIRVLGGKGISKLSGATPEEYAIGLAERKKKSGEVVRELMGIYYGLRFGDMLPSVKTVNRIDELLKKLR
jgi:hypothetical protein